MNNTQTNRQEKNNLKYSVIISTTLHIILIVLVYYFSPKNNNQLISNSFNKNNNTMSVDLIIDPDLSIQQPAQSIPNTSQDKKNHNIKTLKTNVPTSIQQPAQSIPNTSQDKKNHNIKTLKTNVPTSIQQPINKTETNNKKDSYKKNKINNLLNNNKSINNKKILPVDNNIIKHDNNLIKKSQIMSSFDSQITYKKNIYEINNYKNMIIKSISNKFYIDPNHVGKQCVLHIKLLLDGTLIVIPPVKGDHSLCQSAIFTTKLIKLPVPPNLEIYEAFKNITLHFSP